MKWLAAVLLPLGLPLAAAPCATLTAEADRLQIKAASRHSHPVLECEPGQEAALLVQGSVRSGLVRARVSLQYEFLDEQGQRLAAGQAEPLIGQFTSQPWQQLLLVPAGARRLRLQWLGESRSAEGSGDFAWQDVQLRPALALRLESAPWHAAQQPLTFALSGAATAGPAQGEAELSDIDGRVLARLPLTSLQAGRWQFPAQPVGYYQLRVRLQHPHKAVPELQRSLLVLPPLPGAPEARLGLDTAISWYGGDAAARAQAIDLLKALGTGSVRDRFSWSQVQIQAERSDWGRYRASARQLHEAGLQVVQVFHDAPAWARVAGASSDKSPPTPEAAWILGQQFARQLGPWVRHVEFWNEQNSSFFAGYPWEYTQALKAFHAGVRSEDAGLTVVLGAAAGRPGPFFDGLYRNQPDQAFEVLNQHYYATLDGLPAFTRVLQRQWQAEGVHNKPAWLTEIGYSLQRNASGTLAAAEREQVSHLLRSFAQGLAAGYERVFYFLLPQLLEDDYHTWGLLRDDGSPRPAAQALALFSRHIHGAPVAASHYGKGMNGVYFRRADGRYNALVWGRGKLTTLGRFEAATDAMGRVLPGSSTLGAEPWLVRGLAQLPAQARRLEAAVPLRPLPAAPLRLTASISLDGEVLPRPAPRAVALPVAAGQRLRVAGQLHHQTEARVRCSAGPQGAPLQVQGEAVLHLPASPAGRSPFVCDYRVEGELPAASWLTVQADSSAGQEWLHIDVRPERQRRLQRLVSSRQQRSLPLCQNWSQHAAAGMRLDIQVQGSASDCGGVQFRSVIEQKGESWAFPATRLDGSVLTGASAIRVELAALAGSPLPPRPFMLQLIEANGAIWLLDLQQQQGGDGRQLLSGLLSELRLAPWSRVRAERPQLASVRQMMLGWGGYGGLPGQRHGWHVQSVALIYTDEQ